MVFLLWSYYNGHFQNNPDASPTLLVNEESKQVYKIKTVNSDEEYILYLKYASCKQQKEQVYNSWVFNFTDDDKKDWRSIITKIKKFLYICCV